LGEAHPGGDQKRHHRAGPAPKAAQKVHKLAQRTLAKPVEICKNILQLTFLGLTTGGDILRTDWIDKKELEHLLSSLMPQNRLVLEISLATGLRVGDVLNLRSTALLGASEGKLTVREQKTGKTRRIRIPKDLLQRAIGSSGRVFVFEGRQDWRKHRTRQAVFKDLKRIARAFRLKPNVSPHTARKSWAVDELRKHGDLKRIQKLLNHSSEAVTMIYAMADQLTQRKYPKQEKRPQTGP